MKLIKKLLSFISVISLSTLATPVVTGCFKNKDKKIQIKKENCVKNKYYNCKEGIDFLATWGKWKVKGEEDITGYILLWKDNNSMIDIRISETLNESIAKIDNFIKVESNNRPIDKEQPKMNIIHEIKFIYSKVDTKVIKDNSISVIYIVSKIIDIN